MKIKCSSCGKIINRKPSYISKTNEISCSKQCAAKIRSIRSRNNPTMSTIDGSIYRLYLWTIMKKYKLSEQALRDMMDSQNGCCVICNHTLIDIEYKRQSMHIDHNHLSGKIRGLLCGNCNILIGKSRDSISILKNAILYLEENND